MSLPGAPTDESGTVIVPEDYHIEFEVPYKEHGYGRPRDVGSLALFLLVNFYVTGETVLIDGGVSPTIFEIRGLGMLIRLETDPAQAPKLVLTIDQRINYE